LLITSGTTFKSLVEFILESTPSCILRDSEQILQ
jgi:hypothetical protein